MNPSNPFGSPQGGAFQAPSNTMKTGMFQTFGQQSSSNQPQPMGFFQPSAFGQPSALNQPSPQGNTIFGQTPAFGQTSTQPPSQPTISQTPAFGQQSLGMSSSGYGSNTAPAFGQAAAQNQSSAFGQAAAQNQSSAFGQAAPQNQSSAFLQAAALTQSSAFGQAAALTQSSAFGQTAALTQSSAFGQTAAQTQSSAFGQTAAQTQSSAFGQTAAPNQSSAFGQTTAQIPSNVFGQTSSFGQASAFGQAPGFGKQPSAFGNSQMSGSTTTIGQPQPLSFGQTVFGQPSSTSVTTSGFGTTPSMTQSRDFGSSKYTFKPANEALFKPIFSASPEPANPQTTAMTSSPFGSTVSQTSSSSMGSSTTASVFSMTTGAKPGPPGFSFSQPAAAPSISSQNNPLTTGTSKAPSNPPTFTFSQPAAPSSSSTNESTTEPSTPSSFNFSATSLLPQALPLFGGTNFGQPPTYSDTRVKAETEERGSNLGGTNVFARLGKGTKRKEDPTAPNTGPEKLATGEEEEEDVQGVDLPRQPSKRPLMRSRGPPAGLFGRALNCLRKDTTHPESIQAQADESPATPPTAQARGRDVPEKAEESDSTKAPDSGPGGATTPVRRGARRESMESLGGMSPTDCNTLQCRNIPPALNRKDVIEKHFGRFGKVRKIYCRPGKNLAIVHFDDHASAAKAKKKGKLLSRHELLLLWQRKKQSPGDKGNKPAAESGDTEGGSQEDTESKDVSSPLRKAALRGPALSSLMSFSRSSPVKKLPLAKALQFDTESQKMSSSEALSSEAPSSERPVPSSLLHFIGQLAPTAEDKFRLLEQRDKILRQGRPRRTDLVLSNVFVGTCPDMCPEKERYMRETRKQLSVFEVFPDTEMVDHSAAIKEYSRSSADQEEPLPHELRPLSVLSMTMDYLVSLIMDQGHDNYRDWYDFVWNRTRGIRKDIIQQHLCCPHTVSLIEKCTRFHVHCAHHLCEEKLSSFDAKINNENMTKCLQSLKEMYQDLNTRNIYCPLEAEFRQYSVLVKLNDGDILREVQQFRDEVRNSPEVKFAVQVFTAVNSNNFVRFFKLVKSASYLASCLLHRYFNQVRAKALKTMNIAHTVGPRSTAFPVEDLVRMLMFRTIEEGTDFIQQYGLNVNEGMVELSRTAYQEPELPLSQKKSEVILAKRRVLIGEVVNGSPLPNPPRHTPVCSFDLQNKYRLEGPLAEPPQSHFKAFAAKVDLKAPPSLECVAPVVPDVAAMFGFPQAGPPEVVPSSEAYHSPAPPADVQQLFQPIAQPQPVKPPSPPPKPQPVYSNEDIMAELDCVVEEVLGAAVMEVAVAGASYATTALMESGVQVESLVGEVLGQMLQDVSSSEIRLEQQRVAEEKRRLEEARRKQEHDAFLIDFSFSLCSDLIFEVLDQTIKETANSEIKEAVDEQADRVAKCTEQVCTSLMEETLDADIALLVENILEDELQCIHKYIKRWRDVVSVRRQLKRQMRGFPAAPCCVDPRFKLKALAPSAPAQPSMADLARGVVDLGNSGMLALSSTRLLKMREAAIHQMRVHYYYQQLLDESVWAPLDLPALVTENIPDPPERVFWKAVLLLPSDHDSETSLADRILSDWLEVKLSGGKESEGREEQLDGTLQTLCVTNTIQDRGEHIHKVHISIKASRGPLSEDGLSKAEGCSELQGTAALMVLLPAMPLTEQGQEEQEIPLLSALLQLKQLQQAKGNWHCPLPLAILVPGPSGGPGDTQDIEKALMLHTLVQEGLISEFTFFLIGETTSDLQGTKQLSEATRWLLARAPPRLPLSCQTLVQLVEDALSREFSPRVFAHHHDRAAAGLPSQEPAPVIQLYNAVLAHIADKVSSPDLGRLSWPPGEFCLQESQEFVPHLGWNSPKHLAWLREAILSLQLPKWEQISATDSWTELCASISRFSAQIPVSPRSQPLLMSRLENLLERVRLKSQPTRNSSSKVTMSNLVDEDVCPAFSQIPWDDILVICIDHKLKDWQLPGQPVCEDAVTDDGEILVYLPIETLKGFQPPGEWTEVIRQTHREKQQQEEEEEGAGATASAPPSSLSLRQRLFHSLAPETMTAPLDITHTPTAEELLAHNVLQSLEKEKVESQRSMEQLQRWLDGDHLDHLSTPLFIPSSTLLSMPPTIMRGATAKTPDATLTQPDDLLDKVDSPKTPPVPMSWRIKELERQILASHEEELAWKLKLSGLLSIVDD